MDVKGNGKAFRPRGKVRRFEYRSSFARKWQKVQRFGFECVIKAAEDTIRSMFIFRVLLSLGFIIFQLFPSVSSS